MAHKTALPAFDYRAFDTNIGLDALDVYQFHELDGDLNGTVIELTPVFGVIKPAKRLPDEYSRSGILFDSTKVWSHKLKAGSHVRFRLCLSQYARPTASFVEDINCLGLTLGQKYKSKGKPTKVKAKMAKQAKCAMKDTIILEREKWNNFMTSNGKENVPVLQTLKVHVNEEPDSLLDCLLPDFMQISDRAESSVPEKARLDQDMKSKRKDKIPFCSSTELYRLLYGTVLEIKEGSGSVKPDELLPQPFCIRDNVDFSIPEEESEDIVEGVKVVFLLDEESVDKPYASDIAFIDISYEPEVFYPYKSKKCGHICFQHHGKAEDDICVKATLKPLACGHLYSHKCGEPLEPICLTCKAKKKRSTKKKDAHVYEDTSENKPDEVYSPSQLDGILHGTVVSVKDGSGLVRPDRLLPQTYKNTDTVCFNMPPDRTEGIVAGLRVVFLLDKEMTENPYVSDIAFTNVSYDPEVISPYKNTKCGHICFQDRQTSDKQACLKSCSTRMMCGHLSLGVCGRETKRTCLDCSAKSKSKKMKNPWKQDKKSNSEQAVQSSAGEVQGENQVYTLTQVNDVLHGTIISIKNSSGSIRPDKLLPPSYEVRHAVYFAIPDGQMEGIEAGLKVAFLLDKERREKAYVSDIVFENVTYDPHVMFPYKNTQCGHICFQDMRTSARYSCTTVCSKPIACGHRCTRGCEEQCETVCPPCSKKQADLVNEKKTKFTTLVKARSGQRSFQLTSGTGGYDNQRETACPHRSKKGVEITNQRKAKFTTLGQHEGSEGDVPCMKSCWRPLTCGHSCTLICSVPCPTACAKCLKTQSGKKKKQKPQHVKAAGSRVVASEHPVQLVSAGQGQPDQPSFTNVREAEAKMNKEMDLGLLCGMVEYFSDGLGYVLPDKPLPHPFSKREKVFFSTRTSMDKGKIIREQQRAVFVLDKDCLDTPVAINIAFPNVSYNPQSAFPYICTKCNLIGFQVNGLPKPDVCERCSSLLADKTQKQNEHKKSEPQLPEEKKETAKKKKKKRNKDLLLCGMVEYFSDGLGYVLPDKPLPHPFRGGAKVFFSTRMSVDQGKTIREQQRAVFVLGMECLESPVTIDIAFPNVSYNPQSVFPYICTKCNLIGFQDIDLSKPDLCERCSSLLAEKTQKQTKKKKKKKNEDKKPDAAPTEDKPKVKNTKGKKDGLWYGSVVSLNSDGFGYIKSDKILPTAFHIRDVVLFRTTNHKIHVPHTGQRAVFVLDTFSKDKNQPCAADTAFIGTTYNPQVTAPYKNMKCGHINFKPIDQHKDKGDVCMKTCSRPLACGHLCLLACSEECPPMCLSCFKTQEDDELDNQIDEILQDTILKASKRMYACTCAKKCKKGSIDCRTHIQRNTKTIDNI